MTNLLMRKAGLAFDKHKTGHALRNAAFALVRLIEIKTNRAKLQRKKVEEELESGLEYQVAIDVEQLICQDFEISAYDTLRRQCNALEDCLETVASQKECPTDIKEAILTIAWAADKGDVPEQLLVVKMQLAKKYGKRFVEMAGKNDGGYVSKMVSEKLLYQGYPSDKLVKDYIKTITEDLGIADPRTAKGDEASKLNISDKTPTSMETMPKTRKPSPLRRLREAPMETPKETFVLPSENILSTDAFSKFKPFQASNRSTFAAETTKAVMAAP